MARKLKSDRILFGATCLLALAGIVMVYSASAVIALERHGSAYFFLTKQVLWMVLGFAVLAVSMRIDYRSYKNDTFIWTVLGIVGALIVASLFSSPVNGARRWLWIGGLSIQPSELAKIACVLFAALVLERRMHRINEGSYALLPIAIVTGALMLLVLLQRDLGTALSLALIVGTMVFAAGLSYRYVAVLAAAAAPVLYFILVSETYRLRRLQAYWDPWADPLGDGFQTIQSLIAVGTGGVSGLGLMGGVQKLFYLPEPHTDFIYAVIAEELGLVGATTVLVCFSVIAWRGLRISLRAEDRFGSLAALGLTVMIAAQAYVNMSVVLNLLPTKGITLPFVSAGGSSLLASLLGVGVLLNISQHESTGS